MIFVSVQSVTKRKINRVVDAPFVDRQEQIKHLYRHFVFIFCRTLIENGRIFVCKARNLLLAGGTSKLSSILTSDLLNTPYMFPRVISSPSPHISSSSWGSSSIYSNSPASSGGRTPTPTTTGGNMKAPVSTLNSYFLFKINKNDMVYLGSKSFDPIHNTLSDRLKKTTNNNRSLFSVQNVSNNG